MNTHAAHPDPGSYGLAAGTQELQELLVETLDRFRKGLFQDSRSELTEAEQGTLARGGFDLEPHPGARDPLAEGVAEFAALLETGLSVQEAAELAGVSAGRIRQRLTARPRTLVGVRMDRGWRIPAFQFEPQRGRALPGLERVLTCLDPELHPVAGQRWFLAPTADLVTEGGAPAGLSPREWLRLGLPPEPVAELAAGL